VPDETTASIYVTSGPQFTSQALPTNFVPFRIVDDGRIVGSVGKRAAVFQNNGITLLAAIGSEPEVATDINAYGNAVGYATASNPLRMQALFFTHGTVRILTGLPSLDSSLAFAIGDNGKIYGGSEHHYDPSPRVTLAEFVPGSNAVPVGKNVLIYIYDGSFLSVNSSGYFSADNEPGVEAPDGASALIGINTTLTRLFTNLRSTEATAINDNNVIVGMADLSNDPSGVGPLHTYIHTRSRTTFLPFLTGTSYMVPSGINNHGDVVGAADGTRYALFFYHNGVLYDLTARIHPVPPISNVVSGIADDGSFVLTPQTSSTPALIVRPVPGTL
jgi:uncharacterized membrane protein